MLEALDAWEKGCEIIPPMPNRPCPIPSETLPTKLAEKVKERVTLVTATAEFDGSHYGSEYLTFCQGAKLILCEAPLDIPPQGWAFGRNDRGELGWFPPSFVQDI